MISIAKARYVRVSPIKLRQVIDLIRGRDEYLEGVRKSPRIYDF